MIISLDGSTLKNKKDFYESVWSQLEEAFNELIGEDVTRSESLDALYDLLTDICQPVSINISNSEELLADEEGYYDRFIRMIRTAARENSQIKVNITKNNHNEDYKDNYKDNPNDKKTNSPDANADIIPDDNEKEYVIFTITTSDGSEVEMAVIDEFEFEHKDYIAAGRVNGNMVDNENIYIYKLKAREDDFNVEQIKSMVEYERIGKAYLEMTDND